MDASVWASRPAGRARRLLVHAGAAGGARRATPLRARNPRVRRSCRLSLAYGRRPSRGLPVPYEELGALEAALVAVSRDAGRLAKGNAHVEGTSCSDYLDRLGLPPATREFLTAWWVLMGGADPATGAVVDLLAAVAGHGGVTGLLTTLRYAAVEGWSALADAMSVWIKARGVSRGTLAAGAGRGLHWMLADREDEDGSLLVAFGHRHASFDPSSRECVDRALAAFFPEAELVDWDWHDWNADPFARGTWATAARGRKALLSH